MSTSSSMTDLGGSSRPPFPRYRGLTNPSEFSTEDEALEVWEAECEAYLAKYGGDPVFDAWEQVPMMLPDSQNVRSAYSCLIVLKLMYNAHIHRSYSRPSLGRSSGAFLPTRRLASGFAY